MDIVSGADFHAVNRMLRGIKALGEPSEIHGDLCGLLCLLGNDAGPTWVAQVLADGSDEAPAEAVHGATDLLKSLAERAFNRLEGGEMAFTLLLPADKVTSHRRRRALRASD